MGSAGAAGKRGGTKMTRGILLATAAGLVSVATAQAADMPVKAKPAQYVKICPLYGDGFYYIPGTNTCIKVGGKIQLDVGWNANGGRNPNYSGLPGGQDRNAIDLTSRGRADIAMDARSQTQYGVLRSAALIHIQNQDAVESFNTARAFIQWSGWTFGRIKSYVDTFAFNDTWQIITAQGNSDTGANGVTSIAYTWDLGAGVTFDVGGDDRRTKPNINLSNSKSLVIGSEAVDSHATETYPDFYGALHADEAWGFFAVAAGIHNVNAGYYTGNGLAGSPFAGFVSCGVTGAAATQASTTMCGHPSDKVGYFVQLGGDYKIPNAGGDHIGAGIRFAVGATGYGAGGGSLTSPSLFGSGNTTAIGFLSDAVFVNGSGLQLTQSATAQLGYDHYWTPQLDTDIIAGYTAVSYNAAAKTYWAGALCGAAGTGAVAQTEFSVVAAANSCNPNYSFLEAGSKTTWRPFPDLAISAMIERFQVWSGFNGAGTIITAPTATARPTGAYTFGNQGIWVGMFRIARTYNSLE
jgi:hypothetical protein